MPAWQEHRHLKDMEDEMRSLLVGIAVMLTAACATQAKSATEATAPRVGVVAAEHRDIPLERTFTGRVEAVHTVEALAAEARRRGRGAVLGYWIAEADGGFEEFLRLRSAAQTSQLEQVGRQLRQMMPWLESEQKVPPT